MTMRFAHLAQRVFNRPVLIRPEKAELILASLADRLGMGGITLRGRALRLGDWDDDDDYRSPAPCNDRGYDLLGGIAVIQVQGTLVQRAGTLRPACGMTGYDGLRQAFLTAMADAQVRAVLLDIDSPGGEGCGLFDLVDTIYGMRGEKPIWAVLNEVAYSAAYAIASAADYITVPRTGGTGSIGVVCCHVDMSQALNNAGLAVTFIQYGARKTDGASEKPLNDPGRARIQDEVDQMGELFVVTVARNRGLSTHIVRATEAATYVGASGVTIGLADAVMPPDAAFQALLELTD